MDALRDLTAIIEDLNQARSFKDGDEGPWLAGCALDGPSASFARVVGMLPDQDPEDIARSVCATATDYHDPLLPGDDRLAMAVRLRGDKES